MLVIIKNVTPFIYVEHQLLLSTTDPGRRSPWFCLLIDIIVWGDGLSFIIMFPDLAKLSRAMSL
jgi:hypothetical protein